ncbi:MAG: hypothetical protein Q9169_000231 [Polycauliona sp. 2 TL-2023]
MPHYPYPRRHAVVYDPDYYYDYEEYAEHMADYYEDRFQHEMRARRAEYDHAMSSHRTVEPGPFIQPPTICGPGCQNLQHRIPIGGLPEGASLGKLHKIAAEEGICLSHEIGGCFNGGVCERNKYPDMAAICRELGYEISPTVGMCPRQALRIAAGLPAGLADGPLRSGVRFALGVPTWRGGRAEPEGHGQQQQQRGGAVSRAQEGSRRPATAREIDDIEDRGGGSRRPATRGSDDSEHYGGGPRDIEGPRRRRPRPRDSDLEDPIEPPGPSMRPSRLERPSGAGQRATYPDEIEEPDDLIEGIGALALDRPSYGNHGPGTARTTMARPDSEMERRRHPTDGNDNGLQRRGGRPSGNGAYSGGSAGNGTYSGTSSKGESSRGSARNGGHQQIVPRNFDFEDRRSRR